MGSGVSRVVTGSLVGTGSAINVRTVGFRPRKVELYNVTTAADGHWTNTMADAAMWKRITGGTASFVSSNGVTPLADGFTLGTDADLNTIAETVHWVVYE